MKSICSIYLFLFISFAANAQAISGDTLHWAEYRKLSWTDFKGTPIDVQGLSGQSLMVMTANFQKQGFFMPTEARVITVFDRKNSWINLQSQNALSLEYYQVMFDIYEDYSRRLRKEFKHTRFGMDPNKTFQEKYNATLSILSDRNKEYMQETKLGTDSVALKKWHIIIAGELDSLAEYRLK